MNFDEAKKNWLTWGGCCEVCGGPCDDNDDLTRDGDSQLCHRECAVDAQD